jgi:hypothetical protein
MGNKLNNIMSLIKCSECGKEISDHAVTCLSCGNPIHGQPTNVVEDKKPVDVELTSKRWKKKFLWGIAFFIGGWIMLFKVTPLGILLMFIGVVIVIIATIGRWWTNG